MRRTMVPAVYIAVLLLLGVLCTGCGAKKQTATEPTVSTVSYELTHVESGVISYHADEFDATGTLELRTDGTAQLFYGDQKTELIYDESNMWSADNEAELHPYQISGLVLTLDYFSEVLTFVEK